MGFDKDFRGSPGLLTVDEIRRMEGVAPRADARARTRQMFAAWAEAQGREAGWCRVKNEAEVSGEPGAKGAELLVYGIVGGFWWDDTSAWEVANQLQGLDVDKITVRINSPGGYVDDGMAIGNVLRDHKAKVHVKVDGHAASAASVIAMAGDHITMGMGAELMIHDAWTVMPGNAEELRAEADNLDRTSGALARIYAARAGGTAAEWRELMQAESWFDGPEAVAAGLADEALDAEPDDGGAQAKIDDRSRLLLPHRYQGRADAPAPKFSPSAAPEAAPDRAADRLRSASVGAIAEADLALLQLKLR